MLALSLSMVIVTWCHEGNSLTIVGGGVSSVADMADMGVGQRGGHMGHNSDIVGVASGVGIVHREASSHLVGGVSLSISLGLSLAIVAGVNSRDGGIGVDSGGMSIHSSVADGADSIDQAMTIVDPSDDPARGGAVGNLAQGVGVTACAGNKSKNLPMKIM